MSVQAIALPGTGPALPAVRVTAVGATGAGAGPNGYGPRDQVMVSEAARKLSAGLGGQEQPELQLSPRKLRELVTPPDQTYTGAVPTE